MPFRSQKEKSWVFLYVILDTHFLCSIYLPPFVWSETLSLNTNLDLAHQGVWFTRCRSGLCCITPDLLVGKKTLPLIKLNATVVPFPYFVR